eukprot:2285069-Prymnesium_polylepis.1
MSGAAEMSGAMCGAASAASSMVPKTLKGTMRGGSSGSSSGSSGGGGGKVLQATAVAVDAAPLARVQGGGDSSADTLQCR